MRDASARSVLMTMSGGLQFGSPSAVYAPRPSSASDWVQRVRRDWDVVLESDLDGTLHSRTSKGSNTEGQQQQQQQRAPFAWSLARMQGRREYQEDQFWLRTDGRALAVADGHGGPRTAECVVDYLSLNYSPLDATDSTLHAPPGERSQRLFRRSDDTALDDADDGAEACVHHMQRTFRDMTRELRKLGHDDGSTLTLASRDVIPHAHASPRPHHHHHRHRPVMLDQRRPSAFPRADPAEVREVWTVGNVGDSRAVLVQRSASMADVSVLAITNDHNTTNPQEVQRVEQHRRLIDDRLNGSLMLTRSMGDFSFVSAGLSAAPEISVLDSEPEDVLVIGSDGLYEKLSNEDVGAIVQAVKLVAATRIGSQSGSSGSSSSARRVPSTSASSSDEGTDALPFARFLVHYAYTLGSEDNITALTVV